MAIIATILIPPTAANSPAQLAAAVNIPGGIGDMTISKHNTHLRVEVGAGGGCDYTEQIYGGPASSPICVNIPAPADGCPRRVRAVAFIYKTDGTHALTASPPVTVCWPKEQPWQRSSGLSHSPLPPPAGCFWPRWARGKSRCCSDCRILRHHIRLPVQPPLAHRLADHDLNTVYSRRLVPRCRRGPPLLAILNQPQQPDKAVPRLNRRPEITPPHCLGLHPDKQRIGLSERRIQVLARRGSLGPHTALAIGNGTLADPQPLRHTGNGLTGYHPRADLVQHVGGKGSSFTCHIDLAKIKHQSGKDAGDLRLLTEIVGTTGKGNISIAGKQPATPAPEGTANSCLPPSSIVPPLHQDATL